MRFDKYKLPLFLCLLLIICVKIGFSQPSRRTQRFFNKAKELFLAREYCKAIQFAQQAVKNDSNYFEPYLLLADIYKTLDSANLEISNLKYVYNNMQNLKGKVGYRLGEAYYKSGDYKNSLDVFKNTLKPGNNPELRKEIIKTRVESCLFAIEAVNNPVSDEGIKLPYSINTASLEYWPTISIDGEKLVFTRLMGTDVSKALMQEDFYVSTYIAGEWSVAEPLRTINTLENEGAQTISADGGIMFFAACNRDDGLGSCDIYFSLKTNDGWSVPQNAGKPVSSNAWESQPSLSANAGYLYFASNRKGGMGGMDIWRCRLNGFNNKGRPLWGVPENLGDSINTSGNENSPYIHFNNKDLYFSSDRHIGMGGKDIFHTTLKMDKTWSIPKNVGYPVNTISDEQGFIIDAAGRKAYLASDREGNMDIYSFELCPEAQPTPVTYVKGSVKEAGSGKPLTASVEFTGLSEGVSESIITNNNGTFLIALPLLENYAFNISKPGYLFYSESFKLENVYEVSNPYFIEVNMQPLAPGAKMVLKNIYFKTGSYELQPESAPELLKLKELLLQNPGISIEIEGHTDNVGSEEYNQALSGERAKAVRDFLVEAGVKPARLSYEGYGFTKPVASNNSEEGRSLNRRTEVRVIK